MMFTLEQQVIKDQRMRTKDNDSTSYSGSYWGDSVVPQAKIVYASGDHWDEC